MSIYMYLYVEKEWSIRVVWHMKAVVLKKKTKNEQTDRYVATQTKS